MKIWRAIFAEFTGEINEYLEKIDQATTLRYEAVILFCKNAIFYSPR